MTGRSKMILGGIAAGTIVAGAAAAIGSVLAGRKAYGKWRDWQGIAFGGENLHGQTVLITGSSRGLGLALAEEFARAGCNIILCARDEAELHRARALVERHGVNVATYPCDVSKQNQVEHMITFAQERFGQVDILVNNAGSIAVGPVRTQRLEDFQEAMDTMFWGAVYPTLALLPQMISRRRGKIVNVTSIGGRVSVPHLLPYSCAKFAHVGFSEGLHSQLKKFGIHVLTVVPGLMRTGSHLHAQFKGDHQKEFGWFALSGTNPLLSVSAETAARRIVSATRRNQTDLVLGWQAKTLAHAHGIAPGITQDVLAIVDRMLPESDDRMSQKKPGHESHSAVTRSPLTALGKRAARRFNQVESA
jgi:short-subunit dehydrogenase